MNTDDLRSKYGKQVTEYNKLIDDDLWTDDYVLWLEEQLTLTDVGQQRELLIAYENYTSQQIIGKENNRIAKSLVDGFLANNLINKKMTNKDKFKQLISNDSTNTIKINKRRIKYRFFIRLKNRFLIWWYAIIDF